MDQSHIADYFEFNYVKPWNRFSPYIIGIILGYLLHITKKKPVKLNSVRVTFQFSRFSGDRCIVF